MPTLEAASSRVVIELVGLDNCAPHLLQYLPHQYLNSRLPFESDIHLVQILHSSLSDSIRVPLHLDLEEIETFPGERYHRSIKCNDTLLVHVSLDHSFIIQYKLQHDLLPKSIEVISKHITDGLLASYIMRIFRDILYSMAINSGYHMMHGGLISISGSTYGIVGEKGAGKTHAILRLLSSRAEYLANDRFLLHPRSKHVVSFPIVIRLSRSGSYTLPTRLMEMVSKRTYYRAKREAASDDKISLTPRELVEAFSSTLALEGTIRSLFALKAFGIENPESENTESLPLSHFVDQSVFVPCDPTYRPFMFCRSRKENWNEFVVRPTLDGIHCERSTNDDVIAKLSLGNS
jgi:hypothetical protein